MNILRLCPFCANDFVHLDIEKVRRTGTINQNCKECGKHFCRSEPYMNYEVDITKEQGRTALLLSVFNDGFWGCEVLGREHHYTLQSNKECGYNFQFFQWKYEDGEDMWKPIYCLWQDTVNSKFFTATLHENYFLLSKGADFSNSSFLAFKIYKAFIGLNYSHSSIIFPHLELTAHEKIEWRLISLGK